MAYLIHQLRKLYPGIRREITVCAIDTHPAFFTKHNTNLVNIE